MIRRATSHPDPLPDLPPSPRIRRKSDKPAVHLMAHSFTHAECGVIPAGFSEITQTNDAVTCGNCRRILERRRKLAALAAVVVGAVAGKVWSDENNPSE